jgi:hypothetical protein
MSEKTDVMITPQRRRPTGAPPPLPHPVSVTPSGPGWSWRWSRWPHRASELNGHGQVVEPAADVLDDLASLPVGQEAGSHGPGAVGEQLDCGRRVQPAYGHLVFAGDAERPPAGGDQPETAHRSHQGLGQRRRASTP